MLESILNAVIDVVAEVWLEQDWRRQLVALLLFLLLAIGKWKELGFTYPLDGVPTPTSEQVRRAEELLGITPTEPPSKAADVLSPKCC